MKYFFAFLFLNLFFTNIFADARIRVTEYILTTPKTMSSEQLHSSIKEFSPDSIKSLGNGLYLIQFSKDPGSEKLKKLSKQQIAIQPNLKYRAK